jgi:general stress protein YciG
MVTSKRQRQSRIRLDDELGPTDLEREWNARTGGETTKARYDVEHYRELGQRGGKTLSERYKGTGYFQGLGALGGLTTKAHHDAEWYSEIGQYGRSVRRQNIITRRLQRQREAQQAQQE